MSGTDWIPFFPVYALLYVCLNRRSILIERKVNEGLSVDIQLIRWTKGQYEFRWVNTDLLANSNEWMQFPLSVCSFLWVSRYLVNNLSL